MDFTSGIYSITSPSGSRYIGSTWSFKRRWSDHLRKLRKGIHHNALLQNAWDKYGGQGFIFSKLAEVARDQLIPMEQKFIDELKPEYNIAVVAGNPMAGRNHSPAALAKMSSYRKGRPHSQTHRENLAAATRSPEVQAKRSAACKIALSSPEVRAKIVAAQLGKPHSPERRAIASAAAAARFRPVMCIELQACFRSMAECARWLRDNGHPKAAAIAICRTCQDKVKSAYGYRWEYAATTP